MFAHEIRVDWCAPAGVEMVLAILGKGAPTEARQRELASRIHEWETYQDSQNLEWGPSAMVKALAAYGVPGYKVRAYGTRAGRDARRGEGDLDVPARRRSSSPGAAPTPG